MRAMEGLLCSPRSFSDETANSPDSREKGGSPTHDNCDRLTAVIELLPSRAAPKCGPLSGIARRTTRQFADETQNPLATPYLPPWAVSARVAPCAHWPGAGGHRVSAF